MAILGEIVDVGMAQPMDSMNLAWCQFKLGDEVKALRMLDTIVGDGRPMRHVLSAQFYRKTGEYRRAVEEYEVLDSINDEIFYSSVNHSLSSSLESYNALARSLELSETSRAVNRRNMIILFLAIIILIAMYIGIRVYRRHKEKLAYRIMVAEDLEIQLEQARQDMVLMEDFARRQVRLIDRKTSELREKDSLITTGNQTVSDLRTSLAKAHRENMELTRTMSEHTASIQMEHEERTGILSDFFHVRCELLKHIADLMNNSTIGDNPKKEAHRIIAQAVEKYILDEAQIGNMERLANLLHDNVLKEFREQFGGLKPIYYQLFLYCVYGLSAFAISALLHLPNAVAVSNRKQYLKKIITASDCFDKVRFLRYL